MSMKHRAAELLIKTAAGSCFPDPVLRLCKYSSAANGCPDGHPTPPNAPSPPHPITRDVLAGGGRAYLGATWVWGGEMAWSCLYWNGGGGGWAEAGGGLEQNSRKRRRRRPGPFATAAGGGGGRAMPVGGPGTAGRRVRFLRPPPGVHFPLEARVALSPPENDPTGTFPFRTSHPHHNGRKDYENGTNRTAMQRSRLAIPAVAQSKDKNHMARIIKRPRADVEVSWG